MQTGPSKSDPENSPESSPDFVSGLTGANPDAAFGAAPNPELGHISSELAGHPDFEDHVPGICRGALEYIRCVRDPLCDHSRVELMRSELSCPGCLRAFEIELRLRETMIPTESAVVSPHLADRITDSLASIDLSKLDITDFGTF